MPEQREITEEIEELESDMTQNRTWREASHRMPLVRAYNSISCCDLQNLGRGYRIYIGSDEELK